MVMINMCPKPGPEVAPKKIIPSTTGLARKIHAQAVNTRTVRPARKGNTTYTDPFITFPYRDGKECGQIGGKMFYNDEK